MFLERHTYLTYIFHITIGASKPVNARVIKAIVIFGAILVTEGFFYSILCFIGYTEVCMSEKFSNETGFFTYVCKSGKFWGFR